MVFICLFFLFHKSHVKNDKPLTVFNSRVFSMVLNKSSLGSEISKTTEIDGAQTLGVVSSNAEKTAVSNINQSLFESLKNNPYFSAGN